MQRISSASTRSDQRRTCTMEAYIQRMTAMAPMSTRIAATAYTAPRSGLPSRLFWISSARNARIMSVTSG
jgi:hypothetical protein